MTILKASAGLAGAFALSALTLGGCATEDYVNQQIAQVNTRIQTDEGRLNDHDAHLAQLDKEIQEAMARADAAGKLAEGKFVYSVVLQDDTTKFANGKAVLSAGAQNTLSQLAEKLKADGKPVYLEIQGYTDSTGSRAGNYRLGAERADAVRRYLHKEGIPLNRMSTISYGQDEPVATNKTKAGRAANRRVVVVVMD